MALAARLPLAARIVAAVGAMLLLLVVSGGVAVNRLQSLRATQAAATASSALVENLLQAQLVARAAANDERGYLLTGDRKFADEQRGRVSAVMSALAAARTVAPAMSAEVESLGQRYTAWQTAVDAEFALLRTDPAAARAAALGPNRDLRKAFESRIVELQKAEDAAGAARLAQADRDAASTVTLVLALLGVSLVLAAAVGVALLRSVRRPLGHAVAVLARAADGDLGGRLPVTGRDELARLAGAVNSTLQTFEQAVGVMRTKASSLARVSTELTGASAGIEDTARATSEQADAVATAAGDVSQNVQTVAAGSEEMGASMGEIARNVQEAVRVAHEGVEVAASTTTVVDQLAESSAEIGNVVKVITSIAEQTNLLALNATIEAARAGDAGRGFAVVAGEVKDLAQETAQATEVIGRRVEAIQEVTRSVTGAMEQIGVIIDRINTFQADIAAAVEQQTAVTAEMNRNVSEAAGASGRIAQTISDVAGAAQSTTGQVQVARSAAADLESMARDLEALTARFVPAS
jgi:methyl-accepting chemotaxis protein